MTNVERSEHMSGATGPDHVTVAAWSERDEARALYARAVKDVEDMRAQLRGAVDLLRELRRWADMDDDALSDQARRVKDSVLATVDDHLRGRVGG